MRGDGKSILTDDISLFTMMLYVEEVISPFHVNLVSVYICVILTSQLYQRSNIGSGVICCYNVGGHAPTGSHNSKAVCLGI